MGDNRPPRYEEDGRVIYRASGLAMCDKIFVALAQGYSPQAYPAWFQEILDEGSAAEPVIREMYESYGMDVVDVGLVLEREVIPGVWIRGSIDGRLQYVTSYSDKVNALFEAKKIRDAYWARYLRVGVEYQANYPMQVSAYMHMLADHLELDAVDCHFVGGHYVQDEKTQEWSVSEVHPHIYIDPPVPWRGIARRIVGLEKLIKESGPIGEVKCSTRIFPCPMWYLHDEDDEQEPPKRPSDEVIAPLLSEHQELGEAIAAGKAAEKRRTEINGAIATWLRQSGQESGDVSTISVGEDEYQCKYLTSPRAAYTVAAGEQTRVTVSRTVASGEKTGAKGVRKSAPRKAKATKTTETPTSQTSQPGPGPGLRLPPKP